MKLPRLKTSCLFELEAILWGREAPTMGRWRERGRGLTARTQRGAVLPAKPAPDPPKLLLSSATSVCPMRKAEGLREDNRARLPWDGEITQREGDCVTLAAGCPSLLLRLTLPGRSRGGSRVPPSRSRPCRLPSPNVHS